MKTFLRGACAAALFTVSNSAYAANVIWTTPTNATGNASDVSTLGTLVAAFNTGPTTTLNGVTFSNGFTSPITLTGWQVITSQYSNPTFANASYNALVGTGAYATSGTPFSITLSGLTAGQSYAIQLFEPFWNNNWATNFTGGSSTSGQVNLSGPAVGGAGESVVPQSIIGNFRADGTTQQITLSSATSYELLAAAQLRAVPEPATWAMMIGGFGIVGGSLRARRSGSRKLATA